MNSTTESNAFTSYFRDYESSTDYSINRQFAFELARFTQPDPVSGTSADPRTWNRYSVVRNDPMNRVDPIGLCDVVIAGLTQTADTWDTAGIEDFADSIGANLAFPYSNGTFAGVADVALQGVVPTRESLVAAQALMDAASDTGPINVYTFSGGAGALSAALRLVPELRSRIQNITYVSPGSGLFTPLPSGSKSTNIVLGNLASLEGAVTAFAGHPTATILRSGCAHNSNCLFRDARLFQFKGSACTKPRLYSRGGGGALFRALTLPGSLENPFRMLDVLFGGTTLVFGNTAVTTTILFDGRVLPKPLSK